MSRQNLQPILQICTYISVCAIQPLQQPEPAQAQPSTKRILQVQSVGKWPGNRKECDGTVFLYLINPIGDVDGLFLTDNRQVQFPPHMGASVTRLIKPNDRIEATGDWLNSYVFAAREIVNLNTSASVIDEPPSPQPPKKTAVKEMKITSSIKAFLHGPRGDVNGLLMANSIIIRLPPETEFRLSGVLKTGQKIVITGSGITNNFGTCIEADGIGMVGQPVLPIYDAATEKMRRTLNP